MESFLESLSRLKDIHEKEVLGLQNKLLELNSERCRDAQRMEELFAKNHHLREQQKVLKENVRALENRLRAGLCDRCMVTQELARKRQQDFESSHLQSLQHIFLLTNEVTGLKEENRGLKEEVKRLRGLEDRPKPLRGEGAEEPPLPLLLSPGDWKSQTKKSPRGHDGPEAESPSTESRDEEQPVGYRTSPATRISPGAGLPESRPSDMSPQRISNQLHGTIAVVRPGSRPCSTDGTSANGMSPPHIRNNPPSPPYEPRIPLDSLLQASRPSVLAFEALKTSLHADHLGLLSRQLALHLRRHHSSSVTPITIPRGPRPKTLKVTEAEAREEPTSLLGLPGTLADSRDPRLEGTLHLLLAQQQLRAWAARNRPSGLPGPGATLPSPPAGSDSEGPEDIEATWCGGWCPQPSAPGSPREKGAAAVQECTPDKPLDLSDRGRGHDLPKPVHCPGLLSPPNTGTPSPELPQGAKPSVQSGPQTPSPWELSDKTKAVRASELEESAAPQVRALHSLRHQPYPSGKGVQTMVWLHPCSQMDHASNPEGEPGCQLEQRDQMMATRGLWTQVFHLKGQNGVGDSGSHCLDYTKYSNEEEHRPDSDGLDEPDTSDSEALSSEAGAKLSTPGGRQCFCDKELGQSLQRKRKRAVDPTGKRTARGGWGRGYERDRTNVRAYGSPERVLASKKSSRGRWKPSKLLAKAERPRSLQDAEDSSPSPSSQSWEGT
ncbi:RBBP8 N-terminal-like protein [Rhynchocyon petersi]